MSLFVEPSGLSLLYANVYSRLHAVGRVVRRRSLLEGIKRRNIDDILGTNKDADCTLMDCTIKLSIQIGRSELRHET
jgi:hypothetical protein